MLTEDEIEDEPKALLVDDDDDVDDHDDEDDDDDDDDDNDDAACDTGCNCPNCGKEMAATNVARHLKKCQD